jgi:hypothetical protein
VISTLRPRPDDSRGGGGVSLDFAVAASFDSVSLSRVGLAGGDGASDGGADPLEIGVTDMMGLSPLGVYDYA